jgi:hypothetical protein
VAVAVTPRRRLADRHHDHRHDQHEHAHDGDGHGGHRWPVFPLADPVKAFKLRCWARAYLVSAGAITLHEAVDVLQAAAERDGLVAKLGQDEVQQIMATAFDEMFRARTDWKAKAAMAWECPGWRKAAIEYHEARGASSPPPIIPSDRSRRRIARSTLLAAEHLAREGDGDRLRKWLARHGAHDRASIKQHLREAQCRRSRPMK